MNFTPDEISLICIYDTSDRNRLILEIQQSMQYIENVELSQIAKKVLQKLDAMTDAEFAVTEFIQPFGGDEVEE